MQVHHEGHAACHECWASSSVLQGLVQKVSAFASTFLTSQLVATEMAKVRVLLWGSPDRPYKTDVTLVK